MLYAIYRCLYGEDFIQQSIKSIDEFVDKIFVFWDDVPWGDVDHCIYEGKRVDFPKKFDNILDKIRELNNDKIVLIKDHQYNNVNQFTHFVNDIIIPQYGKPDEIMVIEVDHVFRRDQLVSVLDEFRSTKCLHCTTRQIEIWKGFNYRIPDRPGRCGVNLWNMRSIDKMLPTGRQGDDRKLMEKLSGYVHNMGFAVSEKTMYWKHMTALGFSQKIKDSAPNERWYKDKWLSWHPKNNNQDLEISLGYEKSIPKAVPYPVSELPPSIQSMVGKHE